MVPWDPMHCCITCYQATSQIWQGLYATQNGYFQVGTTDKNNIQSYIFRGPKLLYRIGMLHYMLKTEENKDQ